MGEGRRRGRPLPFFVVAWLFRIATVFILIYDRTDTATLPGRLCGPFTIQRIVQWESQLVCYPDAELVGLRQRPPGSLLARVRPAGSGSSRWPRPRTPRTGRGVLPLASPNVQTTFVPASGNSSPFAPESASLKSAAVGSGHSRRQPVLSRPPS